VEPLRVRIFGVYNIIDGEENEYQEVSQPEVEATPVV
jgi:hypothetical protein